MLKGYCATMAPNLSADTTAAIEASLQQNLKRPDFNTIAAVHHTTKWTVREIHRKIRERAFFGATIKCNTVRRRQALMEVIEKSILYLISKTP